MSRASYDLAIIGAGAGGLTAAKFAARLGARLALLEGGRLGGDCTWTGCVPSKALIHVAKRVHDARNAGDVGVTVSHVTANAAEVRAYVQGKVREIYEREPPDALRALGIHVLLERAEFLDAHTIRAADVTLRTDHILITTGAHAAHPSIPGLDEVTYLTYERLFELERFPSSMTVIGGGPLGLEMAQAHQRLGTQVTVVAPRLLPHDDPAAGDVLARVFEREGVRWVRARATRVRQAGCDVVVTTEQGEVQGECLLVSVGRVPNVQGLSLERAGITHSERGIPVDDRLRTNVRHVFAAGDVIGREQFSHVAGWQAFQATRNALLPGSRSGVPSPIAWVTFTDPEVGHVGLTESQARRQFGDDIRVAQWSLPQIDRAVCDDDRDGFLKLIMKDDRILGATAVAARAGEITGELSLAITHRVTVAEIAATIYAYPTYATAVQQLCSDDATTHWVSGALGRGLTALLGYQRKKTIPEGSDA